MENTIEQKILKHFTGLLWENQTSDINKELKKYLKGEEYLIYINNHWNEKPIVGTDMKNGRNPYQKGKDRKHTIVMINIKYSKQKK